MSSILDDIKARSKSGYLFGTKHLYITGPGLSQQEIDDFCYVVAQEDVAKLLSIFDDLRSAVRELYYSGVWTCDRSVDEGALWTAVRDAAGFEPGKSPEALAV